MGSAAEHSSFLFVVDGRWKSAVNYLNPLGTKGNLVHAFSSILHDLWHGEMPYISPFQFRVRTTCLSIQFQRLIPLTFGFSVPSARMLRSLAVRSSTILKNS